MTCHADRGADAGFRANIVNFMNFGGSVEVRVLGRSDWASVTFAGARHRLEVVVQGDGTVGAAADFLRSLPNLEFTIPGHIVADIALVSEERRDGGGYARLELEALTIEDN